MCQTRQRRMIDLVELRNQIKILLDNHAYVSSSALASKLVTLSNHLPQDVHLLARIYYITNEPLRAVELLERNGLLSKQQDENFLSFALLATQCWSKSARHEEVIRVTDIIFGSETSNFAQLKMSLVSRWKESSLTLLSLLSLERGKAYEAQDNRKKAFFWMKQALHLDVRCFEALEHIVGAQLTPNEETELFSSLVSNGCFSSPYTSWLHPVYVSNLGKFDCSTSIESKFEQVDKISAVQNGPTLEKDPDILISKAEACFYHRDSRGAYDLTKMIFELDPSDYVRASLVHIAAMVELGKSSELFYFAHRQVKEYPKSALSWYAVGAYYYSAKKFDASRRYFNKATALDPNMMSAWIGSAHAHAMHDESDRAMAIYRTAAGLFPGSHIPVLGTAMEYLRTNNPAFAQQFCEQALNLCPVDPAVYNELGIVFYRLKKFEESTKYFKEALRRCSGLSERVLSLALESVTFNLGHAQRRAGLITEAIETYKLALSRCPKSASGHASLGLAYHLHDDPQKAIDCYHISLGIHPGDTLVGELMELALVDMYKQTNSLIV